MILSYIVVVQHKTLKKQINEDHSLKTTNGYTSCDLITLSLLYFYDIINKAELSRILIYETSVNKSNYYFVRCEQKKINSQNTYLYRVQRRK